jgi:hypothetical protein
MNKEKQIIDLLNDIKFDLLVIREALGRSGKASLVDTELPDDFEEEDSGMAKFLKDRGLLKDR